MESLRIKKDGTSDLRQFGAPRIWQPSHRRHDAEQVFSAHSPTYTRAGASSASNAPPSRISPPSRPAPEMIDSAYRTAATSHAEHLFPPWGNNAFAHLYPPNASRYTVADAHADRAHAFVGVHTSVDGSDKQCSSRAAYADASLPGGYVDRYCSGKAYEDHVPCALVTRKSDASSMRRCFDIPPYSYTSHAAPDAATATRSRMSSGLEFPPQRQYAKASQLQFSASAYSNHSFPRWDSPQSTALSPQMRHSPLTRRDTFPVSPYRSSALHVVPASESAQIVLRGRAPDVPSSTSRAHSQPSGAHSSSVLPLHSSCDVSQSSVRLKLPLNWRNYNPALDRPQRDDLWSPRRKPGLQATRFGTATPSNYDCADASSFPHRPVRNTREGVRSPGVGRDNECSDAFSFSYRPFQSSREDVRSRRVLRDNECAAASNFSYRPFQNSREGVRSPDVARDNECAAASNFPYRPFRNTRERVWSPRASAPMSKYLSMKMSSDVAAADVSMRTPPEPGRASTANAVAVRPARTRGGSTRSAERPFSEDPDNHCGATVTRSIAPPAPSVTGDVPAGASCSSSEPVWHFYCVDDGEPALAIWFNATPYHVPLAHIEPLLDMGSRLEKPAPVAILNGVTLHRDVGVLRFEGPWGSYVIPVRELTAKSSAYDDSGAAQSSAVNFAELSRTVPDATPMPRVSGFLKPSERASVPHPQVPLGDCSDTLTVAAGRSECGSGSGCTQQVLVNAVPTASEIPQSVTEGDGRVVRERPVTARRTKRTLTRCSSAPARFSGNTFDEGREEPYFCFLRDDLKVDPMVATSASLPIDLRARYSDFLTSGFTSLESTIKSHRTTVLDTIFEGEEGSYDFIKENGKNDRAIPVIASPIKHSAPSPPNQETAKRDAATQLVAQKSTLTSEFGCKDGDEGRGRDLSVEYYSARTPHVAVNSSSSLLPSGSGVESSADPSLSSNGTSISERSHLAHSTPNYQQFGGTRDGDLTLHALRKADHASTPHLCLEFDGSTSSTQKPVVKPRSANQQHVPALQPHAENQHQELAQQPPPASQHREHTQQSRSVRQHQEDAQQPQQARAVSHHQKDAQQPHTMSQHQKDAQQPHTVDTNGHLSSLHAVIQEVSQEYASAQDKMVSDIYSHMFGHNSEHTDSASQTFSAPSAGKENARGWTPITELNAQFMRWQVQIGAELKHSRDRQAEVESKDRDEDAKIAEEIRKRVTEENENIAYIKRKQGKQEEKRGEVKQKEGKENKDMMEAMQKQGEENEKPMEEGYKWMKDDKETTDNQTQREEQHKQKQETRRRRMEDHAHQAVNRNQREEDDTQGKEEWEQGESTKKAEEKRRWQDGENKAAEDQFRNGQGKTADAARLLCEKEEIVEEKHLPCGEEDTVEEKGLRFREEGMAEDRTAARNSSVPSASCVDEVDSRPNATADLDAEIQRLVALAQTIKKQTGTVLAANVSADEIHHLVDFLHDLLEQEHEQNASRSSDLHDAHRQCIDAISCFLAALQKQGLELNATWLEGQIVTRDVKTA